MESQTEVLPGESKDVVPLNTWVLISNLKVAYNLTRRPDGTFNRHLAEFLDRKVPANKVPNNGVASMDATMDRTTGVWARIFLPVLTDSSEKIPIIFYFHGGSFVHSSANSALYDNVCRAIAKRCKAVILSVNYRRAPEYKYPVAYEDSFCALKWLQRQVLTGNSQNWLPKHADLSQCFLMGDSSGGNIVHHVGVKAVSEDLSPISISGHIQMIPMFGGMKRTSTESKLDGQYFVTVRDRDYYWHSFLPPGEDRDHPACNIFGPRSQKLDSVNLPRTLVVVAELDLMKEWQISYAEGLKQAGKDVQLLLLERATVGFFILPNTEHYYKYMNAVYAFIRGPNPKAGSS